MSATLSITLNREQPGWPLHAQKQVTVLAEVEGAQMDPAACAALLRGLADVLDPQGPERFGALLEATP